MVKKLSRKSGGRGGRLLADTIVLDQGAGFLLRVASARANALFEELTGQSETTPQQYGALLTLHQRGPLTPSELSDATETDRSTLGEIVRRLGKRGYVSLSRNGEDGRSKKVSLTPSGDEALRLLTRGAHRVTDTLLAVLPAKQRVEFLHALRVVAQGVAPRNDS